MLYSGHFTSISNFARHIKQIFLLFFLLVVVALNLSTLEKDFGRKCTKMWESLKSNDFKNKSTGLVT